MKKLMLVVAAFFLATFYGISQEESPGAIRYTPGEADGFLIVDDISNPEVVKWHVQVSKVIFTGESLEEVHVEDLTMTGSNYIRLNDEYMTGDHLLTVKGENAAGEIVAGEGPVKACGGCNSFIKRCSWTCVGKTYAYRIWLLVQEVSPGVLGSQSKLVVTPASADNNGTPYYQYFSQDQFLALSNTGDPNYYGLSNFTLANNPQKIVMLQNNGNFTDKDGYPITSTNVFGIQKHLGDWKNYYQDFSSPLFSQGEPLCNQGFGWAVSNIIEPTGSPSLGCNGNSFGDSDGGVWTDPGELFPDYEPFDPCVAEIQDWLELNDEGFPGGWNYWYAVNSLWDCLNIDYSIGAPAWPVNLGSITVAKLDATDEEKIILNAENTFNAEGQFIGPVITLEPGLHYTSIRSASGYEKTVFFEVTEMVSGKLTQSDFLEATVMPVPIEGNEYDIHFEASATVGFNYTLSTLEGTQLYSTEFSLSQGEELLHHVSVPRGIPSGVLSNIITMNDGSQIMWQTVK